MRHRLQWFIYLRAHGLRKGDEHPVYISSLGMAPIYLFMLKQANPQAFGVWTRVGTRNHVLGAVQISEGKGLSGRGAPGAMRSFVNIL